MALLWLGLPGVALALVVVGLRRARRVRGWTAAGNGSPAALSGSLALLLLGLGALVCWRMR